MKYSKKTIGEIVQAIKKYAFRINLGTGAVVIYPDELLLELFGESVLNDICFENEVDAVTIADFPEHPLNPDNPKYKEQLGFIEQLEKLVALNS